MVGVHQQPGDLATPRESHLQGVKRQSWVERLDIPQPTIAPE